MILSNLNCMVNLQLEREHVTPTTLGQPCLVTAKGQPARCFQPPIFLIFNAHSLFCFIEQWDCFESGINSSNAWCTRIYLIIIKLKSSVIYWKYIYYSTYWRRSVLTPSGNDLKCVILKQYAHCTSVRHEHPSLSAWKTIITSATLWNSLSCGTWNFIHYTSFCIDFPEPPCERIISSLPKLYCVCSLDSWDRNTA